MAVPLKLTSVTPTTGLLGEIAPVNATLPEVTVRLTVGAPRWYAPFLPDNTMLLIVPVGVFEAVLIVSVDCADPLEGTVTLTGDHDAVIPVCCQLMAPGTTVPVNPPVLVNVATKLADEPCFTDWLEVFTEVPKSPVPAKLTLVSAPLMESCSVPVYVPSWITLNVPVEL
jgi:hypothetical protein